MVPGYLASAAALTFAATGPTSGVPPPGPPRGAAAGVFVAAAVLVADEPERDTVLHPVTFR